MKNITASFFAGAVAMLLLAFVTPAFAADTITITGDCKCGKCAMHETAKCQSVISAEKDGKMVNYYLVGKVSKDFHQNVCQESKKVTATGTVKEVDGKMEMTVTKIDLVK